VKKKNSWINKLYTKTAAGKDVKLVLSTKMIISFNADNYSYSDIVLKRKEKEIMSFLNVSYFFSIRKESIQKA